MLPFEDDRPRQSWEICSTKACKQLHDGKLWKCPPLAYLKLQETKYNLSPKWDPYLGYHSTRRALIASWMISSSWRTSRSARCALPKIAPFRSPIHCEAGRQKRRRLTCVSKRLNTSAPGKEAGWAHVACWHFSHLQRRPILSPSSAPKMG